MSLHSTLMSGAGIGGLMRAQGEALTYTPKSGGGDPVELTALIGAEQLTNKYTGTGRRQVRQRRFTITSNSSSPFGGVADPQTTATVTYAGVVFAIVDLDGGGDGVWVLVCERISAAERSGPDFRTKGS